LPNELKSLSNYINYILNSNLKFAQLINVFNFDDSTDFYSIIDIQSTNKSLQDIIYAIFNYVIYKLKEKNIIKQCTFKDIINNTEFDKIKPTFNKLYYFDIPNLTIDFFYRLIRSQQNKKMLETIVLTEKTNKNDTTDNILNSIIKFINDKLKKYATYDKVLEFKLRKFILIYDNVFGFGVKPQESGSCTFYSYYNMGIFNLIFKLYLENIHIYTNKDELINYVSDSFVSEFLFVHYYYTNLFIYNIKYKYVDISSDSNINFTNNFFYKLIIDNNLLNNNEFDLIKNDKFYDKSHEKYNNINDLLNINITGDITINTIQKHYDTEDIKIFKSTNIMFTDILKNIRDSSKIETLSDDNIKNTIIDHFKNFSTENDNRNPMKIFSEEYRKNNNTIKHISGENTKQFSKIIDVYTMILLILKKVYISYHKNEDYPYNYFKTEQTKRYELDNKINDNLVNRICGNFNLCTVNNLYYLYLNDEFDTKDVNSNEKNGILHEDRKYIQKNKILVIIVLYQYMTYFILIHYIHY